VTPDLAAAKLGVNEGDIWCRLGTYDILVSDNVHDVVVPLQSSRNTEKELVVARKSGDSYEIFSFKFPVGLMGVRIIEKTIPDGDKLLKAYKAYCEKEKGGKPAM
ncbi:MAG: hypothetical protein J6T06_03330, partial [Victivallales bacterium]|nr:hypothetical protein [Victivallales bacterium]